MPTMKIVFCGGLVQPCMVGVGVSMGGLDSCRAFSACFSQRGHWRRFGFCKLDFCFRTRFWGPSYAGNVYPIILQ